MPDGTGAAFFVFGFLPGVFAPSGGDDEDVGVGGYPAGQAHGGGPQAAEGLRGQDFGEFRVFFSLGFASHTGGGVEGEGGVAFLRGVVAGAEHAHEVAVAGTACLGFEAFVFAVPWAEQVAFDKPLEGIPHLEGGGVGEWLRLVEQVSRIGRLVGGDVERGLLSIRMGKEHVGHAKPKVPSLTQGEGRWL